MKTNRIKLVVLSATVAAGVSTAFAANAYINQVGYRPSDPKQFSLVGASGNVEIVNASGQTALSVTPGAASYWDASGQNVQLVDFSELKTAGKYSIKVGGQVLRQDLVVKDNTFEDVLKAAAKWFYYQRASMALESQYAGKWSRAAGHTNSTVELHNSAGSGSIQSTKGWYDAGDYGRYIVNSGITTYTLLSLYEHFPNYFKNLKWNIPAEGSLPDLLAEIKWNLDWMLTMQANDGSVYHKLTSLGFPGDVMPAQDNLKLYVIGKSAEAAFDFAGVMAVAARVYKPFDSNYANKCLEAAKKAYAWGSNNMNVHFTANPSDVSTGAYEGDNASDEKLFAGTELAITTNDGSYKQSGTTEYISYWGDMKGIATYGKATHASVFSDAGEAKQKILSTADGFVNRTKSGFGVVMAKDDFVWGSNAVASNQGVWLLHAYYLTGDEKYYAAALKVLDYLLGKNPLDMSFVTGYGSKSPMMPHHRPSTSDNVTEPIPGMLVGGPQPGGEDVGSAAEWKCSDYRTGQAATAYTDQRCSYATNEVAINWNAPLAYLAGALEAINAGFAPDFAAAGVARKNTTAQSSSSSAPQGSSSSSAVPASSSSQWQPPQSSSSQWNPWNPASSSATAAIREVVPAAMQGDATPRLRVKDFKLVVEKNGRRYDLRGHRLH
ncbi:glycoside hydrolase family 9 protein [Fibrobacter sp. UBA2449]|uniref:glycoside hydrolase family 9 protein n=1 Tax=Fibrobacter sp. UBA2449 TaxID=1946529 RepID=UPI0025BE81BD|nr:glycoside hydrolase family 9 protein [Fibrobacter sp. UBA2449]